MAILVLCGTTTHSVAVDKPPDDTWLNPKHAVGSWIWTSETHDQQLCRVWRGFEIPEGAKVVKAALTITADNSYSIYLDGRELGRGGDWREVTEYDLTLLLEPGRHALAVEAFNTFAEAGVLAGMQIIFADGRTNKIVTDTSWKVASNTDRGWAERTRAPAEWPPATIVKTFGGSPWGKTFSLKKAPLLYPVVTQYWQTGWFQIVLLLLCGMAAAACLWLMGRLAIHAKAQQVVQRERARIARDLHDDLTAGLTQLILLGEVAQSELPAGSDSRGRMDKVCEKARGLSRSMNEAIWVVNSQRDTLHALVSYVCKHAETFLQPTAIRCRFNIQEDLPDAPCDLGLRRNLFLAVKEALSNAARHSQASELVLSIHLAEANIIIDIKDDGRGFDTLLADRERNGLANMRQRAREAGGACQIISQPGGGCHIEFVAPLSRPARLGARFLLCKGYSDKEIAGKLTLSADTVHGYVKNIYKKLHVRSRAAAVAKYLAVEKD